MADSKNKTFRVFYRDYEHGVSISSSEPEQLDADRLVPLATQLLNCEDNFLGVVDDNDLVLQLYLEDSGRIVMELLFPESRGFMQCRRERDEAMDILRALPAAFGDDLLPGANYVG
ncbi:MAG: hypothetical protein ACWA5Q_09325 [bacterium]